MTPTTPPGGPVALSRAVTAVRAGAEPVDAARAFSVPVARLLKVLNDADIDASSELAVFAAGIVRQALARDARLALELLDRQAARNELARLKELTG